MFAFDCGRCRQLHIWCLMIAFLIVVLSSMWSKLSNYVALDHYLNFILKGPGRELLQLAIFGELQALFPGVKLYIDLVGPAIPNVRSGKMLLLLTSDFHVVLWLWLWHAFYISMHLFSRTKVIFQSAFPEGMPV